MTVTRFAPSPTGYLHIGGLRTALFSYLWARKNNGKFLLRIEDTDLARNSEEATVAILDAFQWVGMENDGEVYYQSKRFDIYKKYIKQLIDEGKAYYCYMSKEELDALRESLQNEGKKPMYDNRYRDYSGEVPSGVEPVVRIKTPLEGKIIFEDGIKGRIEIDAGEIDDFIIARSDGTPTYNFVVSVDDALMGVTDVIRGDDHLSNTPKQIAVYEALGFGVPKFYHVPMILNEEGKKLSKRDGAMDVMEYARLGYLPEAVLNYLVRLGWSHGDQEIFSKEELLELFNPNDINSSASAFNTSKLNWLNSHYIKNMKNDDLANLLEKYDLFLVSHDKKEILLDLLKERATTLVDIVNMAKEILEEPTEYEEASYQKAINSDALALLKEFGNMLEESSPPVLPIDYENLGKEFMERQGIKAGKFFMPLRIALIGKGAGAGVYEIMSILGKNETLKRIHLLENFFLKN